MTIAISPLLKLPPPNPKPKTPNPKQQTLNPKPQALLQQMSNQAPATSPPAQQAMVSSVTAPLAPQAPAPAAPSSSPGAKNALESQISAEEGKKLQESIMGFTAQVSAAPAEFEVDISDLLALTRYSSSSSRELDTAI